MKKLSFMLVAVSALVLGACSTDSDEYDQYAQPQHNDPEAAITIPGFQATGVGAINLADAEGDAVQTFTLSQAELPAGYTLANARIELTPQGVAGATATTLDATTDGATSTDGLQSLIEATWSKAPVARAFSGHVYANAVKASEAVLIDAGTVTVTVTPVGPELSATGYYIVGNCNGWNADDTSLKHEFGGADPYANPTFTITVPAPAGGANLEFKVLDLAHPGQWDAATVLTAGDREGTLKDHNAGGNIVVPAVSGATFYSITINLLDQTFSAKGVNYSEFIYEIGNESSWGASHPLWGGNFDGSYQGYYWLNGEYKFKPNEGDWNGDWGQDPNGAAGTLVEEGETNCPLPSGGAGFYQINVNLATMTYSTQQVTSISAIGDFNSWGGDVDLAYNATDAAWEGTLTTSVDGGVKFRMNHDWTISWGGRGSGDNFTDLTQDNGQNLNVKAGTYDVKLYISCEGRNRVELTRK